VQTSLTSTPSQTNENISDASTQLTAKYPKVKKQEERKMPPRSKRYKKLDSDGEIYSSDTYDPALGKSWSLNHIGEIVKHSH
jgi:hypothetical protein